MATTLAGHMDFDEPSRARVQRFWGAPTMAAGPGLKAGFEAICGGCFVEFIAADSSIGTLRRVQLEGDGGGDSPNRLDLARLNDIDRRMLKESFRLARALQQRMHLDYER